MAGFVPDETVREILQRVDLVRLVGEFVPLRKAGLRFVGLCPFHAEKTPSFSVNAEQGFYYCFGCHAGGDAVSFLRELHGLSFHEAMEQLAARTGVALPEEKTDDRRAAAEARNRSERSRLFEANALAQAFFRSTLRTAAGEAARAYVERRGITEETAERFGIGAAPATWDALSQHLRRNGIGAEVVERAGLVVSRGAGAGAYDRFRNRVTFPILDVAGKVLGFSARVLGADEGPKYMNSPESVVFHKGESLFGLYQARRALRAARRAVLVEGNVDVVTLSQAGFENVVAPMGTALTEQQVLLLKRFVDDVDLVYDGDSAGRAAAAKSLQIVLASGLGGRMVLLPQGEDPDTFVSRGGRAALDAAFRAAPALGEHFLETALAMFDGSVPSKSKVIEAVRPLFGWVTSPVERDEYARRIEQRLLLPAGSIARYVGVPEGVPSVPPISGPGRGGPKRAQSRLERDVLELVLWYPPLLSRLAADGGAELFSGERRRWLVERCLTHYDEWKGTLDALALLEELEEPVMRDFVARAINDEPTIPEDESETAFAQCMAELQERARRSERERLAVRLKQASKGELGDDVRAALQERMRLARPSVVPDREEPPKGRD